MIMLRQEYGQSYLTNIADMKKTDEEMLSHHSGGWLIKYVGTVPF